MRKWFSFGLTAILISAVILGCGGERGPTDTAKKPQSPAPAKPEAPAAKKKIVVGFAQTGAESGWREAHTQSVRGEAEKRGIDLRFSSGEGMQENQIKALENFIAMGVDCIILSPLVETGWDNVLKEAQKAKIPVLLLDRTIETSDPSLYTCFLGSDFVKEGEMAGEWLAKKMNGKANIVELEGNPGSAPAVDRAKGFRNAIAKYPDMKIIDSITGEFRRIKGKEVMEALLKKHGDKINVLYAHNDDMAIGAIGAITDAGKEPGKDIIIVSVDALGEALKCVVDGTINCTVQCNPLLGPKAFDTVAKILAGEQVPKALFEKDEVFDSTNAAEALKTWKY